MPHFVSPSCILYNFYVSISDIQNFQVSNYNTKFLQRMSACKCLLRTHTHTHPHKSPSLGLFTKHPVSQITHLKWSQIRPHNLTQMDSVYLIAYPTLSGTC